MEVLIEKVKFKSQFKDNKLTYIFTTTTTGIRQIKSSHSFNTGKEISNVESLHKLDNVADIIDELKTNYATLNLEVDERETLDWYIIDENGYTSKMHELEKGTK